MIAFNKPTLEYGLMSPLLILFGVAILGVLIEAFVPRERRYLLQTLVAGLGLIAAFAATIVVATRLDEHADGTARGSVVAEGAIVVDGPTVFLWGILLVLSFASVLLFAERHLDGGVSAFAGQAAALPGTQAEREASTRGLEHTEIYPLTLFAVAGMMLFTASNDLITMFVALEVFSLPLYLLCGLARRRRLLSQEAALKYFMLGAYSSGFFLYGIALTYGYAGSTGFAEINEAVQGRIGAQALLLGGLGLILVGLLFKVGAVPFHNWTPDVYQGAPTSVTAFMGACTKIAAFGGMLRLLYVAFGSAQRDWEPVLWVIAILTMAVGSIFALTQTDIKRLLAYSSIAHAGYILVGMVGLHEVAKGSSDVSSVQAIMFYLVTYGFMTVGAFGIVTMVRDAGGESNSINRWAGLGKESPVVAGIFAFFLLGMAGIPLTSGFTGKWAVFTSAASGDNWPLVVVAVLFSVVAAFFYLKVIVAMYFAEPDGEAAAVTNPSVLTIVVISVCLFATVALGIVPGPVLDLAANAGSFIR